MGLQEPQAGAAGVSSSLDSHQYLHLSSLVGTLDRSERVTLWVTLSGGANVTRATPAEERCDAWTRPSVMTEQAPSNHRRQWKLRDEGFPLARHDGRRFLPPV